MNADKQRSRTDAIVLIVVLVLFVVGTNIGLGLAFKAANESNAQLRNELIETKRMMEDHDRGR